MGKRYYHADRVSRLISGSTIDFQLKSDELKKYATDRADFLRGIFPKGISLHGWNYLANDKRPSIEGDFNGMIEMLAESVRREKFPGLVSRFESLFACSSQKDAEDFASKFPEKQPDGTLFAISIWEVETDGRTFAGDRAWLSLGQTWIDARMFAESYWTGKPRAIAPLPEVLLELPIRVIRKVA